MSPKPWTIRDLLTVTTGYLKEKEIDSPRLSAEVLLAHQLKTDRVKLYLNFDQPLSEEEISGYRSLVRRRVKREPIQYIRGIQEFWSLEFDVGPRALIPRPESELLVEQVIALCRGKRIERGDPRILDLGTGCGALAISLARELRGATVCASDISGEALDLARSNARKLGVEERIDFRQGDLWEPFEDRALAFNVIVSNPPYVPSEMFDSLAPEVRDHEPKLALDGGEGGMYYIEKIISQGQDYLDFGGWLLLEMDPGQTLQAIELFEKVPHYGDIRRIKDYAQDYRVVMARKTKGLAQN